MPEATVVPEIPVFTQQTVPTTEPEKPAPETEPAEGGDPAQNPAEQAPAAPAEGETPTEEQPEKRNGKSRYERRLDKAYRRAAEAQARADYLERQIAESKPKETPSTGAPRLEDFTDIEDFRKAVAKHERAEAIKEYEGNRQKEAFKQFTEQVSSVWEGKFSQGEKKYEDFDEIVGEIVPNNPMAIAIMQADNGHEIAYYLGTHMEEARRIAALDPLGQARAIGRLETKLAAEPPKPKVPSKAPAPITPLAGKSGGASDMPLDTDDPKTWQQKENARLRKLHGIGT